MSEKIKTIISTKGTDWKPFLGDILPQVAESIWDKWEIGRYPCNWLIGCVFYQGDTPETATKWIIVTDNGGFYKVHAQYALWHTRDIPPNSIDPDREYGMQCVWSTAHLKRTLKNLYLRGQAMAYLLE